jgi:predicted NodU family carbamoyl transferase
MGDRMSTKQVVGVHNGHNAAAAVVTDGRLSFALQEERLTRLKNQGGLPLRTLKVIAGDFADSNGQPRSMPVAFGGKNLTSCAWKRDEILASYGNTSVGPMGQMKRLAQA